MSSDRLYIEVEKAKEVLRAAVNFYRGDSKHSPKTAVELAENIAEHAFRHVKTMTDTIPNTNQ